MPFKKVDTADIAYFKTIMPASFVLTNDDELVRCASAFNETQLNLMKQIKHVFDPKGILNPGKIFVNS